MSVSGDEIKLINNILPKSCNKEIIEHLCNNSVWRIATEHVSSYSSLMQQQKELGFSYCSHGTNDIFLNTCAKIIVHKCMENLNMNAVIERFMWNMYYPNQESFVHTDVDKDKDNFLSTLYNLNTTSGGTKIKDVFYKDQESQAKLFKSNLDHQGIGPKEHPVRFNLNIVLKVL